MLGEAPNRGFWEEAGTVLDVPPKRGFWEEVVGFAGVSDEPFIEAEDRREEAVEFVAVLTEANIYLLDEFIVDSGFTALVLWDAGSSEASLAPSFAPISVKDSAAV